MTAKIDFGSDALGLKHINFEKINVRRIKPFEDRVKTIQDHIDVITDTNKARSELKGLTNPLQKSLRNISLQTNAKHAYVTDTTERVAGALGDDYLDVTASGDSHIGALQVQVEQLATYACTSFGKLRTGFNNDNNRGVFNSDALSISVTGVEPTVNPVIVYGLYGQPPSEVASRINAQLKRSNVKAEAVLQPTRLVGGVQQYTIDIRSTITGHRTIELAAKNYTHNHAQLAQEPVLYNPLEEPQIAIIPHSGITAPYIIKKTIGQNAIVHVNGQKVESNINVVKLGKTVAGMDIPNHIAQGITLTLKRKNTVDIHSHNNRLHHQTIRIEQDKNAIADRLGELVDAYNNLKEFIATQERRNAKGDGYEEDAYLAKTRELSVIKDLLYSMLDRINVAGLRKVDSVESIGILREQDGSGLTINQDRLKDVTDSDFDEIVQFFNSNNGFCSKFIESTSRLLQLIDMEAKKVPEKLTKAQEQYAKADIAMQKEQKKIDEEMAKMELINMQASMIQMYFQAMMSQ